MQIVFGDNSHEMLRLVFWKKNTTTVVSLSSTEFDQRVPRFNLSIDQIENHGQYFGKKKTAALWKQCTMMRVENHTNHNGSINLSTWTNNKDPHHRTILIISDPTRPNVAFLIYQVVICGVCLNFDKWNISFYRYAYTLRHSLGNIVIYILNCLL